MARTRLEYWEKWQGAEWDAMAAVVEEFNAQSDSLEVVMVRAGDTSSSPDLELFCAADAGRKTPDIIGLEDRQVIDLASRAMLAPLFDRESLPAHYDARFGRLVAYEGRVYAMPVSSDLVTLHVNLDCVKGTSFAGGRLPGDLRDFATGLSEVEQAGYTGFVPTYPGWWPHGWPRFFGGSWFDEQGRFTPQSRGNEEAYEWMSAFRLQAARHGFRSLVNPLGHPGSDPFLDGQVAMVFDGGWIYHRLLKMPNPCWVPAAFPSAQGEPGAFIESDVLCIPRHSPHPEAAAEFIRFATEPRRLQAIALGQFKILPLKEWPDDFMKAHPIPHVRTFRRILDESRLYQDPAVPEWIRYNKAIQNAVAKIWSGTLSPRAALRQLEQTFQDGRTGGNEPQPCAGADA